MNYLEIGEFQNRFKENFNKTLLSTIDYGNLTYGQVWSNAEHICKIWKKTGAKSGDCIAFILNNNPSLLVSYIACAIGGFVANPINPTLNIKIIDSIIKLTKPKITLRNPPQLNKNINIVQLSNKSYFVGNNDIVRISKRINLNEGKLIPKHLDFSNKKQGKLNRFKRSCLKTKSTLY